MKVEKCTKCCGEPPKVHHCPRCKGSGKQNVLYSLVQTYPKDLSNTDFVLEIMKYPVISELITDRIIHVGVELKNLKGDIRINVKGYGCFGTFIIPAERTFCRKVRKMVIEEAVREVFFHFLFIKTKRR